MKLSFLQDYITKLQQFNQIQRLWYHLKVEIRIFQSIARWTILNQHFHQRQFQMYQMQQILVHYLQISLYYQQHPYQMIHMHLDPIHDLIHSKIMIEIIYLATILYLNESSIEVVELVKVC